MISKTNAYTCYSGRLFQINGWKSWGYSRFYKNLNDSWLQHHKIYICASVAYTHICYSIIFIERFGLLSKEQRPLFTENTHLDKTWQINTKWTPNYNYLTFTLEIASSWFDCKLKALSFCCDFSIWTLEPSRSKTEMSPKANKLHSKKRWWRFLSFAGLFGNLLRSLIGTKVCNKRNDVCLKVKM